MRKTVGVEVSMHDAFAPFADRLTLAKLFESVAPRADTAASDIDLLLVSDELTLEAVCSVLTPAEERLGRHVNPTLYTLATLRRRRSDKSGYVSRVLDAPHVALMGSLDGA